MVLFTALIGPHFVDWTSYRETFEREASGYVGRPVTVAGKASVRLLPTPILSFTDIVIGDSENPDVEMERFRAEVELAPLLKGEVRVIQMAVERPRFRVDISGLAQNRGVFASDWRLDPDRISLERLQIVEGSAIISDSVNEREWVAQSIDAVLEASTLLGPGRVEAELVLEDEPLTVSVGFGRFTNLNTIATNLRVTSPNSPVTLSADGTLHLSADTPPSYEGTATIEGVQPEDAEAPRSRWADFRASGAFALEPADLTIEEMQISYGATERPLIIEASGQVGFGERPRFDLVLGARQIDLDRTLAGGEGDPFAIEAAVGSLVALLPRAAPPPLPGSLRLEAQGVVVGGSVVQAVGIDLVTAGNSWVVEDFAAMLPGETRIDLSGTLGLSADTTFRGQVRMASRRPAAFASWWRGQAGSAGQIGSFAVEANLDLAPDNQQLSNLVITTSGGALEGSVGVRSFEQLGERIVDVNLRAEEADLVETRALAELLIGKTLQTGWAEQTTLSFSGDAEVLSAGGFEAQSVVIEGGLEGGQLNFRKLSVADLAGASIDAHGSIQDPFGTPFGRLDASVAADDIGGAAKFLLSVLPESDAVRRFESVAPLLSPVAAEISAEAGAEGERVSLALSGSFADTRLSLQADGAGSLAKPETFVGALTLDASGPDSATILRQVGFDLLPLKAAPLQINANFDGALASAGRLTVKGSAVGIDLTYDAETMHGDAGLMLSGDLTAESGDLDSVLLLAGIATPGLEGHAGAIAGKLDYSAETIRLVLDEGTLNDRPIAGSLAVDYAEGLRFSGALEVADASLPGLAGLAVGFAPDLQSDWSDEPFTRVLPETLAVDVSLKTERLDLGAPIVATDATLDVLLSEDRLELDIKEAAFAGGAIKGTAAADLDEGQSNVSVRGDLAGVALQSLVWERIGLPVASGTLDVSFEAVGRGRSPAAIVATLSGSGTFTIDEGRLNALNAEALTAVMEAADSEAEPDENAARETFASLFGSGALSFGRAAGSFSIADGAVNIPPVAIAAGATKVLADATLDLNSFVIDSDWTVRVEEGGEEEAEPYVPLSFEGPISRPTRSVDLVPLLNLMRSRFQENKLRELEELQRRRDEEEARRAEEEEARRAAEEEARLAEEAEAERQAALRASQAIAPDAASANEVSGEAASAASAAPAAPAEPAQPLELAPAAPAPAPAEVQPEPVPQPTRRRAPRQRVEQAAPAPAPPQPEPEPEPQYRMLPNGVWVKVR